MPALLHATEPQSVPSFPVREVLRGTPLLYKHYREVESGHQHANDIMGSSSLQSILVMALGCYLKTRMDRTHYWLGTNEAGIRLGHRNSLSTDLGVFDKSLVQLNDRYFSTAPQLAVEVDVKVDTVDEWDYMQEKSSEMIRFGCEQVIWVLTRDKKIISFSPADTKVVHWKDPLELKLRNTPTPVQLNLQHLLDKEGIDF